MISKQNKNLINQLSSYLEARDSDQPFPQAINAPLGNLAFPGSLLEHLVKPSLHNLEHS